MTSDKSNSLLLLLALCLVALSVASLGTLAVWQDTSEPESPMADGDRSSPSISATGEQATPHTKTLASTLRARESRRERVATGRSERQHWICLRFTCETLRHNAAPVWRQMNFRPRITDEAGRLLAECTGIDKASVISIPLDVTRIAIIATGYERKVIPTPATHVPGAEPITVLLRPDARVWLRAKNLPQAPGNFFVCKALLATGTGDRGEPILSGRVSSGDPIEVASRSVVSFELRIPSGVPAVFHVVRSSPNADDRSGFVRLESKVISLAKGEEREVVLDLAEFGVLSGRVTGVAPRALLDQVLSLAIVDGASPDAPSDAGPIRLDAKGHFRIAGLADQEVTLRLRTQGGESPALKEVGTGRNRWSAGDNFIILEPELPVHGVVPTQDGRVSERAFRVQLSGASISRNLQHRIPLFTRRSLARGPLFFFVEDVGGFQRDLSGAQPNVDGLYRVEVPAPGGALRVLVENQPQKGVHLMVMAVANRVASRVDRSVGIAGNHIGNDWNFQDLAAGTYRVLVCYDGTNSAGRNIHSERLLAEHIVVKSRGETRITVPMPKLLVVSGEVVNWPSTSSVLSPDQLRLQHGERPHTTPLDRNGHFSFTVLGPFDGVSEAVFSGRRLLVDVKASDVAWLKSRRMLTVTFPGVRERWLLARAISGGRIGAHVYPKIAGKARGGEQIRASQGRLVVPDVAGGVDGILWEQVRRNGRETRLVQGWFRLAAGGAKQRRLDFGGRFIEVAMTKVGQSATLTLKPPAWWRHPQPRSAALRLTGKDPRRLWLPVDAVAVIVNGKREIPVGEIGDTLILD